MRAAISLLVSSLAFGPLASNCQAMVNQLSDQLLSTPDSQQLLSANKNNPKIPSHRGSGRRELTENFVNIYPVV
ncbi:hypothetical protein GS682_10730 [Nostoc sp. B(2019)]|jgi:hypothetical protein|uniref:Uncharacterized protein n=1 Tax=Komarekiella delphini-convector SJRDD-AB1 TaxID=2593771 RepID=A0AA40T2P2_9NOST|nr:hypothetical protein [Komarekiella delphini-convector]MBD6619640.1 hypothetical protein [Komarekiella delphini-convector SJRDD-AB1]NDJ22102.1 hypothetical protein [Nostoc sp. B(2019)]